MNNNTNTKFSIPKKLAVLFLLCAPFAGAAAGFDFVTTVTSAVNNLVLTEGAIFKPIGDGIFLALTVIMLISHGKKIIFSSSHHSFQHAREGAMEWLTLWVIVMVCMFYYDVPIWGMPSIHQVFPTIGVYLASHINTAIVDTMLTDVTTVASKMGAPSLWVPQELMAYALVYAIAFIMEAVMVLASSFGAIALGVGAVFGPLMIPWLLVPRWSGLFYSWVNFMLKWSMFGVVAAAQAFIWATAADSFITTVIAGDYTLPNLLKAGAGLAVITIGAVIGLLSTGSLTGDLFSGTANSGGIGSLFALRRLI